MLKVTELSPSEVRVTWSVTNTSIITHITVEYKGFGIHGSEWEVVILQPQETKTHLTDLETDSTYLVRVGKSCDYQLVARVHYVGPDKLSGPFS